MLALCCSFAPVWLAVMAAEFVQVRLHLEPHNPAISRVVDEVHKALIGIDDPRSAAIILQAIDRALKTGGDYINVNDFLQVWDRRNGTIVVGPLRDLRPDDLEVGYSKRTIAGALHYIYFQRSERWEIAVGLGRLSTWHLLKELHDGTTVYLLAGFPFMLLPCWLALRVGLRPLRDLARDIGDRASEDLEPVNVTGRHAELNLLADAFNQQLARVRRLIVREREFVQDAAHELRTPMAVIAVNAHAVADAPTAEARAEAEAQLHSGLSRTSHLIEQLLILSRLDVGGSTDMATRDVVPLVKDDLARAAPLAVDKDIELSLEAPESLNANVEIHALSSVVGNLVENAIRYGRDRGRVAVTVKASRTGWSLRVEDDGIGIPLADRSRIFERFYRGNHDEVPGTGLGLAIARAAAARLGGTVGVGDGLGGRGCGFTVQFPRASLLESPLEAESMAMSSA